MSLNRLFLFSFFAAVVTPALEAATVSYEFISGNTTASLSSPEDGVTATDVTLGNYTGLVTLESPNALRFTTANTAPGSGTVINDGRFLSFTITIPAGTVVNLNSISLTYETNALGNHGYYSNARIFSSLTGFNASQVVANTIGTLGKESIESGNATETISLSDPSSNPSVGGNVGNDAFTNISGSVTFYLPWVAAYNGSETAPPVEPEGWFVDVKGFSLDYTVVPEPSTACLGILGGIAVVLRRGRRQS